MRSYWCKQRKIQTIKGLISTYEEHVIASLRQSPEVRRAKIEAHKQGYKKPYMEILKQVNEQRWKTSRETLSAVHEERRKAEASQPNHKNH